MTGTLLVADLTDPMVAAADANAIFQVLVEQFRASPLKCGKLVCFDEVTEIELQDRTRTVFVAASGGLG